jgi:hypothetical protein
VPHDHHFLSRLDRVTREETDLALALYRDPELVRFLLSRVNPPEGIERVALSLDDPRLGPFLVMTRDGHFVTCLGRGMNPTGLHVVTRERMDAAMLKMEELRARMELAKERGGESTRLVRKLLVCGPEVSREEFLAVCAVAPPLSATLLRVFLELAINVHETHEAFLGGDPVAGDDQMLHDLWKASWGMGHLAMVLAEAGDRDWLDVFIGSENHAAAGAFALLTGLGPAAFVLRSAWAAARIGKKILPAYKARFQTPSDVASMHNAGWGLQVMRLRHASLHAEITKALGPVPTLGPDGQPDPPIDAADVPTALRRFHAIFGAATMENRETLVKSAVALGRELTKKWAETSNAGPPWQWERAEDVPEELALPGVCNSWGDVITESKGIEAMLYFVPFIARAKAEEFYYPDAFARETRLGWHWHMGKYLVDVRRTQIRKPKTYRAETTKQGRNDPCACGSGKKYKKCHGA